MVKLFSILSSASLISTTTGNSPEDFTIISDAPYLEAPTNWTEYTFDLSAYEGQNIYIAINVPSVD